MKNWNKPIRAVVAATFWISLSEFIRNEFIAKAIWVDHYQSLGLEFPSELINGAVWGLWSLLFAIAIYLISKQFSLRDTTLIAWLVGFVMMWVVLWNLDVLPPSLLLIAVPLSLLEAFVAAWIIQRLTP